jgi:hypothetical protein
MELETLSLKELKDIGKLRNIPGRSKWNREEAIMAILNGSVGGLGSLSLKQLKEVGKLLYISGRSKWNKNTREDAIQVILNTLPLKHHPNLENITFERLKELIVNYRSEGAIVGYTGYTGKTKESVQSVVSEIIIDDTDNIVAVLDKIYRPEKIHFLPKIEENIKNNLLI